MEKHIPTLETRFYDLAGTSSLNFNKDFDLEKLATELTSIDLSKYKPLAVKVYMDKEIILTFFAADKEYLAQEDALENERIPIKKFKVTVDQATLSRYVKTIQFTLVCDEHKVENFEVIN
jgi:hypothetical protein